MEEDETVLNPFDASAFVSKLIPPAISLSTSWMVIFAFLLKVSLTKTLKFEPSLLSSCAKDKIVTVSNIRVNRFLLFIVQLVLIVLMYQISQFVRCKSVSKIE